jgi:hypothetical protein
MTEEQEVPQEEPVAQAEQTQAQPEPQVEAKQEETPADKNWKQAHQALQAQKAEIEALRAELQKKTAVPEPEDELDKLDPEEYITAGKAQKLAEKKALQAAKQMVQEYSRQNAVVQDEARMREKYEDYDYVVNTFVLPDIKNDPALAHKLAMSKNPAETAYKLGKLSDSYEEQMTQQKPTSPKAEKILKNSSRPTSANAVSPSLKKQADQFANMSPQEVWAQSQKYARGA